MKARILSALGLTLLWSAACSQLVGITDTEVVPSSGAGGETTTAGGVAKPDGGNSSGGVANNGGTAQTGRGGASNTSGTSSGGSVGTAGNGGVATGSAGAAGAAAGEAAGGEAPADRCTEKAERCSATGHELCTAGVWAADPCPVNKPTCEGTTCIVRGPTMANTGTYYIDSTEVTVGQYKAFLTAKAGDTSGQPAVCAWNTSFYEAAAVPLDPDAMPISEVDWCDATAFCSWAGKRLCGAIAGGPIARADLFEQSKSQWYRACAGTQGATHPSNANKCNSNGGFGDVAPVATFPGCEGRTPGVFDLEGNVAEWVDSCDGTTGAKDICSLAGGNIIDSQSYCEEAYDEWDRTEKAYTFGFRCCSK